MTRMGSRFITLERAVEKIRQRRRSEREWQEIVARQARSGMTVQAFCEQEGIVAGSLYGWRAKLGQSAQESSEGQRRPRRVRREKMAQEFIDLGALEAKHSRFEVRLEFGCGVLLQLVRG